MRLFRGSEFVAIASLVLAAMVLVPELAGAAMDFVQQSASTPSGSPVDISTVCHLYAGSEGGFTLIELSIVLVIIGLIVGSVLVGQDLVRAAQVRHIVSEVDKYALAINTFRGKYGALPGDLSNASSYLSTTNGNGDGRINAFFCVLPNYTFPEFVINTADNQGNLEEVTLANEHLAKAGLIPLDVFNARTDPVPPEMMNRWYVNIGSRATNLFAFTSCTGRDVIRIDGAQKGASSSSIAFQSPSGTNYPALTTVEAYGVDVKMDDGLPGTGSIVEENQIGDNEATVSPMFNAYGANNAVHMFGCWVWDSAGGWDNQYNLHNASGGYGPPLPNACGLSIYQRF